jgi:hypothetical protein
MAPIFTGSRFGFGGGAGGRILNGLTATGGIISNFVTDPGATYRTHVFTSPGTFTITSLGDYSSTVEYVVVAGGGGGGGTNGPGWVGARGGNSGSMSIGTLPISIASYPVTVGGGGNAGGSPPPSPITSGGSGSPSSFGPISSSGGGGGSTAPVDVLSPPTSGVPGGSGAGGAGSPGSAPYTGGSGGIGLQVPIYFRNLNSPVTIGTPGPNGSFYLAGGGGSGGFTGGSGPAGAGGSGGGGEGGYRSAGQSGVTNTGGGGGGAGRDGGSTGAGAGGSGIVIISYQV